MHDVGKPRTRRFLDDGTVTFHHHDVVGAKLTRKRMKALRFSNDEIDAVTKLVELHLRFHGYGSGEWTDSAVRRYVRDAGDQLERLHILTRADCTTRNQRKADRLRRTYDDLEERIARLSEEEELASIRPDLDGNQIMEILGIGPGREVGEAYHFLLELRMDRGPMSPRRPPPRCWQWWARAILTSIRRLFTGRWRAPVRWFTGHTDSMFSGDLPSQPRSVPCRPRSNPCSRRPSRSTPRPRQVWALVSDVRRMAGGARRSSGRSCAAARSGSAPAPST